MERTAATLVMRRAGLWFVVFLVLSLGTGAGQTAPKAVRGVMDLRTWDFRKDGNIDLNGEWEFCYGRFLSGAEFDTIRAGGYMNVPATWKGKSYHGTVLPASGYASYRLRVLLPPDAGRLSLHLPTLGTAYRLFANGVPAGRSGTPGRTKESTDPQYIPQIVDVDQQSGQLDLLLHVSNFHYWKGGLFAALRLGNAQAVAKQFREKEAFEYFGLGVLLFISVSMLFFYIYRRRDRHTLYFSVACFVFATRALCDGERIINELLPGFPWQIHVRLELVSLVVSNLFMLLFLRSLWGDIMGKRTVSFLQFLLMVNMLVFVFIPPEYSSYCVPFMQVCILTNMLYVLRVSGVAARKRKMGGVFFFIAIASTIAIACISILFLYNIIAFSVPLSLSSVLMALSLTFILAKRSGSALTRVEKIAEELEATVQVRTRELMLRSSELEIEKNKSDKLLLNILPASIADRLKDGETTIADHFREASIIFIDMADFTRLSARTEPQQMVRILNEIFTAMDQISAKYGIEKIKTIGDCYMAAAGIPVPREDHAEAVARMALDVRETMKRYRTPEGESVRFRIGLDSGPVVAGVIGEQKFIYDLWGDAVNTASRMEESGEADRIQVTERFREQLTGAGFTFTERGDIEIKGKGRMRTWWLEEVRVKGEG